MAIYDTDYDAENEYFTSDWNSVHHEPQYHNGQGRSEAAATPWFLVPKTIIDDVLVFLCIIAFCFGLLGNVLCLLSFHWRRRSCLSSDVALVAIYWSGLFLLIRSLFSFHLQFMVTSHEGYHSYVTNKLTVCILPYGYASIHMAVFYLLALIAALQYIQIGWPRLVTWRPRHVIFMVTAIIICTFLLNVHFLLVHCQAFEYQLYVEYVKTVWIKSVFIDGSAFIIAIFFLLRTLAIIKAAPSNLPDKHILRLATYLI